MQKAIKHTENGEILGFNMKPTVSLCPLSPCLSLTPAPLGLGRGQLAGVSALVEISTRVLFPLETAFLFIPGTPLLPCALVSIYPTPRHTHTHIFHACVILICPMWISNVFAGGNWCHGAGTEQD